MYLTFHSNHQNQYHDIIWVFYYNLSILILQDNETHNLSTVDYGCMFDLMINAMVTFLLFKVKAAVEKKVGKKLETYLAVSYKTQVVAGTNYFVKVLVYYLCTIKPQNDIHVLLL